MYDTLSQVDDRKMVHYIMKKYYDFYIFDIV